MLYSMDSRMCFPVRNDMDRNIVPKDNCTLLLYSSRIRRCMAVLPGPLLAEQLVLVVYLMEYLA